MDIQTDIRRLQTLGGHSSLKAFVEWLVQRMGSHGRQTLDGITFVVSSSVFAKYEDQSDAMLVKIELER